METTVNLAIIGSRNFVDYDTMCVKIKEFYPNGVATIISGGAKGADSLGARYAKEHDIPITVLTPKWKVERGDGTVTINMSAGFERNTEIVSKATDVIAFWDGKSNGTADSIRKCRKQKKKLQIVYF
jgi:hypothetical protein